MGISNLNEIMWNIYVHLWLHTILGGGIEVKRDYRFIRFLKGLKIKELLP